MKTSINRIDLPNVEVHTSCVCYQKGDARTVRQYDFEPGTSHSFLLDAHNIIFVLKGRVHLSAHNVEGRVSLRQHDFVFLPASTKAEFHAPAAVSTLFVRLENLIGQIPECDTFRFHRSVSPETAKHTGIYPLKANDRIKHFLEGLLCTEADGLKCSSYARLVAGQLLFLIQVYYPQEMYTRFYSSVFSPDVVFSDFVVKNWKKYATINEMAEALSMSGQQFSLRFRKVFGKTPGAWMLDRKAEYIYHDVCSSHKSLKNIAEEYGFSMPNFIRFCRTNFGSSPGVIRNNLSARLGGTAGVANVAAGGTPPCAVSVGGACPAGNRITTAGQTTNKPTNRF